MTSKRRSRSVRATEAGLKKLNNAKDANRDRTGQKLTFERIAEKAGIDPKTVKNFFYGGGVDRSSALAIVETALGLKITDIVDPEVWNTSSSEVSQAKLKSEPTRSDGLGDVGASLVGHNNLPFSGVVKFVGRSQQLSELQNLLQQNNRVAITGMGGVGKTELAVQYAYQHTDTYKGGICWLDSKRGNIGVQIVEFALTHFHAFMLPQGLSPLAQVQFCWQRWALGQALVIIDDVAGYKDIQHYLPSDSRFKVLLTTRERLSKPIERLDLEVLRSTEAVALLKVLVGRARLRQEPWFTRRLCNWMGLLPLGLELVGHYLAQDEGLTLAELMRRLERKRLKHSALQNPEQTMTAQLGVSDAFELSWERLDEPAQQMGCFLSLYAPVPIDLSFRVPQVSEIPDGEYKEVVEEILETQGVTLQETLEALEEMLEDQNEARKKLVRLNLLQSCGEGKHQLHQLIREFLREKLETLPQAEDLKKFFVTLVAEVARYSPNSTNRVEVANLTPTIPHLEEAVVNLSQYFTNSEIGYTFTALITFYESQGFYKYAEHWCRKFLPAVVKRFPEQLFIQGIIQARLGKLARLQGHYDEAQKLLEESCKILENDPHSLAYAKHELGALFICQDQLHEAENILKQCIELYQESEDFSKLEKTTSMKFSSQLRANVLDPERLLLRNIVSGEIFKSKNSDELIQALNMLGIIYQQQGRYLDAESVLVKSLEIAKQLMEHSDVRIASYKNNLAHFYKEQGRIKEAQALFIESWKIFESILGETHPGLSPVFRNLGNLYSMQGSNKKAEEFFKRALTVQAKNLGKHHPEYASILNDLGLLYLEEERDGEAEPLLLDSLKIIKTLIGTKNLDYACTLNNLGLVRFHQKQIEEARKMYHESLAIKKEILGDEHPDVASSFHNLADSYFSQGQLKKAEELWRKAEKIAAKKFPENHPDRVLYSEALQGIAFIKKLPANLRKELYSFGESIDSRKANRNYQRFVQNAIQNKPRVKKLFCMVLEGEEAENLLNNPNFFAHLVPVAQRIFLLYDRQIKQQAVQGYSKQGKGIVLIEVQDSYDLLKIGYLPQHDCRQASQNAPSEMWNGVLHFLDLYNPKHYFIVLIIDPLENPGSNSCHSYMQPIDGC